MYIYIHKYIYIYIFIIYIYIYILYIFILYIYKLLLSLHFKSLLLHLEIFQKLAFVKKTKSKFHSFRKLGLKDRNYL